MEEILRIIMEYVAIWAPSLVAMLGVVMTILTALSKTKEAFDTLKNDKTIKELSEKVEALALKNNELIRCNKLLLESITKIKGYADAMKED